MLLLIALAATLAASIFLYHQHATGYWRRRGVLSPRAASVFGHVGNPFNRAESFGVSVQRLYRQLRARGLRHAGLHIFTAPVWYPLSLDLLKHVLTKDFAHFTDRGFYHNEADDPIGAHLFAIGGPKWRHLRSKLTPTFTSGKMRTMFPTLVECVGPMSAIMERFEAEGGPVDIKEVLACFTTDIIGSCAFGLEFNSFAEEDSQFRVYGKKVLQASKWEQVKFSFASNLPNLAKKLHMRQIPKDLADFFNGIVQDTVKHREKNNVRRPDFMQLLIDMKATDGSSENDGKSLTIDEIAAQCFIFFLAGFETSSTTMTFALYELARNEALQERVREEVERVGAKFNGEITYEMIKELKYMNQVIDETLRMYPPLPVVTRTCVKDYKVPNEDLVIEKGTRVFIPIMGVHYDPEYFPEPEKFDPERFSDENRGNVKPYSHIPFGEGPRVCIGLRFGVMQSKVGLASLLKKYRFTVSKKTQEPIQFQVKSFILAAEGDVWLNAEKIK